MKNLTSKILTAIFFIAVAIVFYSIGIDRSLMLFLFICLACVYDKVQKIESRIEILEKEIRFGKRNGPTKA